MPKAMSKSLSKQNVFSKKGISILILLFINLLFAVKYASRANEIILILGVLWVGIQYLVLNYLFNRSLNLNFKLLFFVLISFAISVNFFVFQKISVQTLNVDRWSVISSFWDAIFNHQYPYFAKSHMGNPPGPMPIYFLMALPFHLIGEIGWMPLMAIILVCLNKRMFNFSYKGCFFMALFLLSSPFFLWETFARSTVLLNSTLVFLVFKSIYDKLLAGKLNLYLEAILFGLVLSTRFVFVIPFLVLFIYALKHRFISFNLLLKYGIISMLTFALTFLPLLIFYPNDFWQMNPFLVQSGFLMPSYYTYLIMLTSVVLAWFLPKNSSIIFYSGLILFFTIIIYLVYHIFKNGFHEAYFGSSADISYFIFSVPFLLYFLFHKVEVEMTKIN
jgi:hypothetical protein